MDSNNKSDEDGNSSSSNGFNNVNLSPRLIRVKSDNDLYDLPPPKRVCLNRKTIHKTTTEAASNPTEVTRGDCNNTDAGERDPFDITVISPMDRSFFNKFKKSIRKMTVHDLEELVLQKLTESILYKSGYNECRQKICNQYKIIEKMGKRTQDLEDMVEELMIKHNAIVSGLLHNNDNYIVPPKIVRTVALQVNPDKLNKVLPAENTLNRPQFVQSGVPSRNVGSTLNNQPVDRATQNSNMQNKLLNSLNNSSLSKSVPVKTYSIISNNSNSTVTNTLNRLNSSVGQNHSNNKKQMLINNPNSILNKSVPSQSCSESSNSNNSKTSTFINNPNSNLNKSMPVNACRSYSVNPNIKAMPKPTNSTQNTNVLLKPSFRFSNANGITRAIDNKSNVWTPVKNENGSYDLTRKIITSTGKTMIVKKTISSKIATMAKLDHIVNSNTMSHSNTVTPHRIASTNSVKVSQSAKQQTNVSAKTSETNQTNTETSQPTQLNRNGAIASNSNSSFQLIQSVFNRLESHQQLNPNENTERVIPRTVFALNTEPDGTKRKVVIKVTPSRQLNSDRQDLEENKRDFNAFLKNGSTDFKLGNTTITSNSKKNINNLPQDTEISDNSDLNQKLKYRRYYEWIAVKDFNTMEDGYAHINSLEIWSRLYPVHTSNEIGAVYRCNLTKFRGIQCDAKMKLVSMNSNPHKVILFKAQNCTHTHDITHNLTSRAVPQHVKSIIKSLLTFGESAKDIQKFLFKKVHEKKLEMDDIPTFSKLCMEIRRIQDEANGGDDNEYTE